MGIRFFIDGDLLLFNFDFDRDLVRTIAKIPPDVGRKFNEQLKCWSFPLDKIPVVRQYISIPDNIIQQYTVYVEKCRQDALLPEFEIEVGAAYSRLVPLKKINGFDPLFLESVCSFDVKNAKYSEAYKNGDWDGRYRLFNRESLQFPTGLLYHVKTALSAEMYEYRDKILYEQPQIGVQFKWELHNVEFRDYQLDAIQMAITEKRGILQLATGAGKTLLSSGVIQRFGLPTLFMVHTKDLLYQAYNAFKRVFSNASIGIVGDGHAEIGDITIATIQTIAPKISDDVEMYGDWKYDIEQEYDEEEIEVIRSEKPTSIEAFVVDNLLKKTKLLIWDEIQHLPSRTFYKVAMKCNTPYRFGLSASPFRDDGFDLKIEAGIGNIIYKLSASDLIERGYLVKPHIKFIQVPPKSYPRTSNYAHVYKDYIVDNTLRNDIIVSIAHSEMAKHRQILILVKHIRHLNILHDAMPEAKTADGSMKGKDRQVILSDFLNKKFQILIATTIADEGLDIPSLDVLILAGSGKSSTKAIQRVGRVLRLGDICPHCNSTDIRIKNIQELCVCNKCDTKFKYRGKSSAIIYDFIDQAKWVNDHYYRRKDIYESERLFEVTKHMINIK